jgi:hypothetical protein
MIVVVLMAVLLAEVPCCSNTTSIVALRQRTQQETRGEILITAKRIHSIESALSHVLVGCAQWNPVCTVHVFYIYLQIDLTH